MNFFDTFDVSRSATPTAQSESIQDNSARPQPEVTLNEEVNQVVGQLGRLWGGFRKQSQIALETAKKDFGSIVVQAQKELGKLTTDTELNTATTSTSTPESLHINAKDESSAPINRENSAGEDEKSSVTPEADGESTRSTSPTAAATTTSPFHSFLSRVQSSVPPNIAATIQANIPDAIRNSTSTLPTDFAHLSGAIASELQRVQGVTRAQAEEYVHMTESLLKDASEFLKDAVKIIPPEDDSGHKSANVMWDGSDVWLIPSMTSDIPEEPAGRGANETARQAAAFSRAETLLHRLKRDPEVIKVDPSAVEQTKDMFECWLTEHVSSREGGIDGTELFERVKETLEEPTEGQVLMSTRDLLVPSFMDSQTFWTRYFFRVYQIEKDEEKRKALLEAQTTESEEDFNWEEDEEDDNVYTPSVAPKHITSQETKLDMSKELSRSPRASVDTLVKSTTHLEPRSTPISLVSTPSNTSPRESSESSYDVVSTTGSSVGAKSPVKDGDEDGDSDWE